MNDPAALRHPGVDALLSLPAQVQRWLDVEAALARACASAGLVDPASAEAITAACEVDAIDLPALDGAAAEAATPIIPLVRQLESLVPEDARGAVHVGATSQDILDTAAMLGLREGLRIVVEELIGAGRRCAQLADEERGSVMVGRTLLQPAVPITFGLKAARWLAAFARQLERLYELSFPAQLGSAAGTLAPYGLRGLEVLARFAEELDLDVPALPWHAERDDLASIVATMALVAGTCASIAGDLVLLAQPEVGEVTDAGAGGSSTMPHKRNPVDATFALAAARLATAEATVVLNAPVHEHERAAGAWQAEWAAVPRTLQATAVAAARTRRALENLRVDRDRMRRNLDATGGSFAAESLALALAPHLGRQAAHHLVAELMGQAKRQRLALHEVAAGDDRVRGLVTGDQIDDMTDPGAYLGATAALIDRALDRWHRMDP